MKATDIKSILFLTYHFPPEVGGIQTRISKYVEKLSERGIRVSVLVAGYNPGVEARSARGSSVKMVPGGLKRFPKNALSVAAQVATSRADVVHVFTGSSTLLGVYSLAVAKLFGAKAIVSFFGREDFLLYAIPPRVFQRVSTVLSDSIDVNSDSTAALLPLDVRSKVHVLMGAAEQVGGSSKVDPGGPPVFLFVGRLVQRKGVDDLLRAFAMIKPDFPTARLSIVGGGPEMQNLVEIAGRLGITGSVEFKGVRKGRDLDREYDSCVACILPSKSVASDPANEGLGLTLIEASMHGKPLIGTRHGGIPEIVADGKNGILVDAGEPDSLAGAMRAMLLDKERAEEMGREGLRMARSLFNWDKATDVLLESYAA